MIKSDICIIVKNHPVKSRIPSKEKYLSSCKQYLIFYTLKSTSLYCEINESLNWFNRAPFSFGMFFLNPLTTTKIEPI